MDQTKFGGPDAPVDEQGNCFAACVATIFDLPLEQVDSYLDGSKTVAAIEAHWWEQFVKWAQRELGVIPLHIGWAKHDPSSWAYGKAGLLYIANGTSCRGLGHSVVFQDRQMVHDPHPLREGLIEIDSYTIFAVPHIKDSA